MTTTPPPASITVSYDQFQLFSLVSWVEANNYDPFVAIDTKYPGVILPTHEMTKPTVLINLAARACGRLQYLDDRIEANVRFGGRDFRVTIPYRAIAFVQFRGTVTALPLPWMRQDGTVEKPKVSAEEVTAPVAQAGPEVSESEVKDRGLPEPEASVSDVPAEQPQGIKRGHLRVIK